MPIDVSSRAIGAARTGWQQYYELQNRWAVAAMARFGFRR
jgi:hypothetical protein